jgi:hypothetical protein
VWRGRPRLGKDSEVRASPELIHSLPDYVSGSLSIAQMVKNRHITHQWPCATHLSVMDLVSTVEPDYTWV